MAGASILLGSCARGKPQAGVANTAPAQNRPVQQRVNKFPVKARDAMETLNNTIAEINRNYFSPRYFFNTAQDIAEGQRYLLHLMSAATEFYLEGNPARPRFVNMVSPTRKYLGDNPDALYFFTQIYGNRYYRITGKRDGSEYISFTAYTGGRQGNWNGPGLFHINHRNILFNTDGSYEILVGPQRRGAKNWLQTNGTVYHMIARYYYEHQQNVTLTPAIVPELNIAALDPIPSKPAHMNDREVAQGILSVVGFLRASTLDMKPPSPGSTPVWWSSTVNRIGRPTRFGDQQDDVGFGALDNTYAAGPYQLKSNQALVMDGILPDCFFANVVLWNRLLQTDDYTHNRISLNRRQMKLQSNSRYRIVVSARDPQVPNWLDTCGRNSGFVQWRFLLAEGSVARPKSQVVPLGQVASLPLPG